MSSTRNVVIAVVATCCLLVVAAQGGFRDGHRHRFYPHYPSFSRGVDVAQDPNTVDENYGWSWGASQGNQQQQQQNNNNPYNADFSFNSNEFFGGLNGAGQGQGGNFNGGGFNNPGGNQQQNQGNPNVPSRPVTTVTPTTTAPVTTAAPAAPTQPGASQPVSATQVVYSDEFYNCMGQCRTTNEWNPVCGTDNNDYNNLEKLNCANSCGGNVQQLRRGPCRPFGK